MHIETSITEVPSGFSGYKYFDTRIVLKKIWVDENNSDQKMPVNIGHCESVG